MFAATPYISSSYNQQEEVIEVLKVRWVTLCAVLLLARDMQGEQDVVGSTYDRS